MEMLPGGFIFQTADPLRLGMPSLSLLLASKYSIAAKQIIRITGKPDIFITRLSNKISKNERRKC